MMLPILRARGFGVVKEKLPSIAESIKDVTVIKYLKEQGDFVEQGEEVLEVETHKGNFMVRSESTGKVLKYIVEIDTDVEIGTEYIEIEEGAQNDNKTIKKSKEDAPVESQPQTEVEDKQEKSKKEETDQIQSSTPSKPSSTETKPLIDTSKRMESTEKMSRLRKTVSTRLKDSQNTYAQVTTFQEVDMSGIMTIRKELGEEFNKKNGVKLGFMSFFLKASGIALIERPLVNSVISMSGNEIISRNYVDISVAVSSPKGLVVPVIRDVQNKSFSVIERNLVDFAKQAAEGKLAVEDMEGGTFTISNGGVFGSMLSVPIINPPQSAILGMHNIVNRPVVRGDQIVSRPIMYLSLSYDHRLLDGREGAGFLKRVSDLLQDPRKILLEY